ncbi:MAG: efflux transporter outer membrane subunit [Candidatus Hydrogenedentes bacterium]|nr:efflux transporter outer membrane subunit [Candidatus Hydrogenedentota bacterium]
MRAPLNFAAAAALAVLAAGCVTGPDYDRPDLDTPPGWVSEKATGVTESDTDVARWWEQLQDPVLNGLIRRAVESNLDLRIAGTRVREARAARGIAESALMPQVGFDAAATRSRGPEQNFDSGPPVSGGLSLGPGGLSRTITIRGRNTSISQTANAAGATTGITISPSGGAPDRTTDLFRAGFDASWELDVFGGNRRAIEAADAELQAAIEAERDVLVSLAAEVALNYIDLRAAQQRLAITQRNIEAQAETVNLTSARYDAGISSELDAVRAEALLATFQGQVPLLEQQIASAIYRIGLLLGGAPGSLLEELEPVQALPAAPSAIPVGLPSELLRRRPDIRVAERQLAAQNARIGVAMAERYPRFFLTGGVSSQSNVLGNLAESGNLLGSIGPRVNWPVFQGGRIRANIEVQNARQEAALLRYEQTLLGALGDVEHALVGFNKEQVFHRTLKEAVAANQRAVKLANERYQRGLEGFLNVLQAQRDLFNTEDQLVQSESIVLANLVALYKALGGGWDPNAVVPDADAPANAPAPSEPAEPAAAQVE